MLVIKSKDLTKELNGNLEAIEKGCRKVIDETEYEVPSGITVAEIPGWKKLAMRVTGIVMAPFRFLI